ncbi:O-antigen ligase family protein [Halomonas sp. M5N1S17]|uniref:O-antigen ligase family protein n=1 Tax=Halomonas alkalisoli TaxID=2907158 RepID=UPI001F2D0FB7|nr:O-antigen ligase family protein [Halomonas alkalisoli]MCE9662532.1 O-antigen ligase family protein [Halomonas alkalisoli]
MFFVDYQRVGAPVLMRHYTSLAVFLLGAIALVVSSGYSLGAVMLLLGSVILLVKRPGLNLDRSDWLVIAALVAYASVGMAEAWWDGQGSRGIDKPLRFVLAIPAMLLIMAYPPRLAWMWSGIATGAVGAGIWAGWQKLVEEAWRAEGHTHVIQFGNLSMLLGVLCLAGLGWAVVQPRRNLWFALLLLGALGGILGSLFSGSRGGWIGFPIVLLVLYRGYGRQLPGRIKVAVLAVVVVGASSVYALPQTGVQSRVHEAFSDVERYISGESRTSSVGARFEMWKGAYHLILEKPVTGWGHLGYREGMDLLAEEGVIHPRVTIFGHAHNEFIDAFAKRGVIGLAVLLALYLVPMRFFARQMAARNLELRSLAVAGVLLPVAYIDFGLSQVFLAHNSGVMMFAFWLAVLWGSFQARIKAGEGQSG